MASVFLDLKIEKDMLGLIASMGRSVARFQLNVIRDVALFWHHQLLVGHFTPGAESRFDYDERSAHYLRKKRGIGVGQGRFVANILTGRSLRSMQSFFTIRATDKTNVMLRMQAPKYFTNPFVGQVRNAFGLVNITRQPDKPAEVTRVNDADMASMRRYAGRRLTDMLVRDLARKAAA